MIKIAVFLSLSAVIFFLAAFSISAQTSRDGVWSAVDESQIGERFSTAREIVPDEYKVFRLNKTQLETILNRAPEEVLGERRAAESETVLTLPLPNGKFAGFRIVESSIMAPELAAKYPQIKSYLGGGVEDRTASVRLDLSPNGFRAMIVSAAGTSLIEPYAAGDSQNYISFEKQAAPREGEFACLFEEPPTAPLENFDGTSAAIEGVTNGAQLRTYRLALAATGEYTSVFRQPGDTDEQAKVRALAAMNTTMNRVNGVYERELAIRFVLVANTDLLIYTDGATDPYTNNSGSAMLGENQTNINSVIGAANYDIGHVFSTGGGGVATLNSPCGGNKARGVTGLTNPTGDVFAIDYVAHEIGHQFGARHTFNGSVGSCGSGNRSAIAAYEPGSGVTIMGYAGICGSQNLARNSIDTFHVKSLEEIVAFVNGAGSCSVNTPTNNDAPIVTLAGGGIFNIPKNTPFALNAGATDAEGGAVTFDWQQYDLGGSTTAVPNTDADGARPIFRPYLPTASGARTFPSQRYVLDNAGTPPSTYTCNNSFTCLTGEMLPQIARTMNFQVIARDNQTGGGAFNTATAQVIVDAASGPFKITAPNAATAWSVGSTQNVTWDAANTTAAPINAEYVKISLSTDGGQTFTRILRGITENDGSETVTVPPVQTSRARIKIEAVGNIFFDISDADFSISINPIFTRPTAFDFDGDAKADVSVFRPSDATWYVRRSQAGFLAAQFGVGTDKAVPADYDGDGRTDLAVFRDGAWYVMQSGNNQFRQVNFGQAGDVPVPADYDGDARADFAVFRAGIWYFLDSSNGQFRAAQFGLPNDRVVPADFDGDNKTDVAVYRDGDWFVQGSQIGFAAINFGLATDKPVVGDYDGDRKADQAVFRAGVWYLNRSRDGFAAVPFGVANDVPAPADYDGDGKFDLAVFRGGNWYLSGSASGFAAVQFGNAADRVVPASFLP